MMWQWSQVLLLSLWALALGSPVPPRLEISPAIENQAVPVRTPPNPSPPKGEGIHITGSRNPNGDPSTPRLHRHKTQTVNNSDTHTAYRNIAFLNPTSQVRTQRAHSPVRQGDLVAKMRQPSFDVSYSQAMVPNYFVMNPPYSKVATELEADSNNKGKSRSPLNGTANELDAAVKVSNLTLREQHLVWKKEMLEKKGETVDTKVYQVQNNIIVHSHNASDKFHGPYKVNSTKSGNKSQINIDNTVTLQPVHDLDENNAEKSLALTTQKIGNRRLLVNSTGLNPNEISLRPNEIRVSVTLRDKDGKKIIVPAIYSRKVPAPPPQTNTENPVLLPVDRNVDINDILSTTSRAEIATTKEITTISERIAPLLTSTNRPEIATTEEITTISERIASLLTSTNRPEIVTTEEITTISERIAPLLTSTNRPEIATTEEITTISERIASLISTTKFSQAPGPVTPSRIPVTPTPSRIFHQSTDHMKNNDVSYLTVITTTAAPKLSPKLITAPKNAQGILTSDHHDESIKSDTIKMSQTTGRPLVQQAQGTIPDSVSTGLEVTNPPVSLDQRDYASVGLPDLSPIGSAQSDQHQTGSAHATQGISSNPYMMSSKFDFGSQAVDASLESLLLSSEKAFNESKIISEANNSTGVPPFLQDIITKIDDRLTELIRQTVVKYVADSSNATDDPTGAAKAIPHQTNQIKINLAAMENEATKSPTKATLGTLSFLDSALGSPRKAPPKSEPGQKPLIKINLDAEPSSPRKGLVKINLDGEPSSPRKGLVKINLDAEPSSPRKGLVKINLDAEPSSPRKGLVKINLDAEPSSPRKGLVKINLDAEPSSPHKGLVKINLDAEPRYSPQTTTPKPSRFSRFRSENGILGLTQIEPILERITGEISSGAERVRKELSYLAEDSADSLMKNVEVASDRVSEISATSYRGALQTRDAMNRLLGRAVENLGKFVSNAVQDTVKTAFGTAQSVGQFIHDLNVNAMDGILKQGSAVRNLFSNTINDMSEATNRTVQVLSRVVDKNTRTLLNK